MATFGYMTKGGSTAQWGTGYLRGCKFTIAEAGQANSITMYLKGGTAAKNFRCLIYADNGGYPGALVAVTETLSIAVGWDGWKTFQIASGGALSANTPYWLFGWSEASGSTIYAYYDAGDTNQATYSSATWDGAPDPFPSGGSQYARKISVYCTYTPSGGGQTYEVYVDAIAKGLATSAEETVFRVFEDAVVKNLADESPGTAFNLVLDAVIRALATPNFELSLQVEAVVRALADVVVERICGQVYEVFKDAVAGAQTSFTVEVVFNVDKSAVQLATAITSIESLFNISHDAVVKVVAEVSVAKEGEVRVTRVFLVLGDLAIQLSGG
jgi:hypothetical protein